MEIFLLASMVFADGALSEYRGLILERFPGFDPSRFDLFSHASLEQSLSDLRYSLIGCWYWHICSDGMCRAVHFIFGQQNPSGSGHFVGQRNGRLIDMTAL